MPEEKSVTNAAFYVSRPGSVQNSIDFLKALSDTYNILIKLNELPTMSSFFSEKIINYSDSLDQIKVLPSEELYISSVRFSSPGFWEVFGKLNPLNFIVEITKSILDWKIRNKSQQLELARFNYESVNAYIDLLERYEKIGKNYEKRPTEYRRFIKEQIEQILINLEEKVIPYLIVDKKPGLVQLEEKPKEYVTFFDLKGEGSRQVSGFMFNVLDPENEALQKPSILAKIANMQSKLSNEQVIEEINNLIDMEFVIYDRDQDRLIPTEKGISFYHEVAKAHKDD